ncbi:hypothetical protein O1L60_21925 [Streptomyces diastatochromogenes]|nr:hypothetical protein [Streptomyces diastatochromogenes]
MNAGYRFDHVSGDVTIVTDGWQVDEDFVAAVSVRVSRSRGTSSNGLLVDAETVVIAGARTVPIWRNSRRPSGPSPSEGERCRSRCVR